MKRDRIPTVEEIREEAKKLKAENDEKLKAKEIARNEALNELHNSFKKEWENFLKTADASELVSSDGAYWGTKSFYPIPVYRKELLLKFLADIQDTTPYRFRIALSRNISDYVKDIPSAVLRWSDAHQVFNTDYTKVYLAPTDE